MSLANEGVPFTMPVQPANTGSNGGMWGGDWSSWIILFLIFGMFGFGGWGGFGFGGGQNGGVGSEVQRGFDHSSVVAKLDGITQGLCDSTYAVTNAMTNGFNNTNMGMMQGFNGVERGFCNLSAQLAQCCCGTEKGQMQVENTVGRGFCDVNYNLATNTNAIIQNSHSDTDRVIAKLDAMEMARKDETIDALRSQVNSLNLAQSQANQNNYLINQLRPCPTPAYITCNPWASQAPYGSCGTPCGC